MYNALLAAGPRQWLYAV